MYLTIIGKIKAILDTVSSLTNVYDYPEENVSGTPVAVFYPTEIENEFLTNREDFTFYKFRIEIIARTKTGAKTKRQIFNEVLAGAVDDVMEAIMNGWDTGQIAGSRSWLKLDSGLWDLSVDENGINAVAMLDVTIKVPRKNT